MTHTQPGVRNVFLLLPTQNSRSYLARWFEAAMADLGKLGSGYRAEVLVAVNGSQDGTAAEAERLQRQYATATRRILLLDIPEPIGKVRAVNRLVLEARARHDVLRAVDPGTTSYLHLMDDDSFMVDWEPFSQIERNIQLLESSGLKTVGTTPVTPPIRWSWAHPWRSFFVRVTNPRKGADGVALAQVYGQSYTVRLDDFPAEGIPEELLIDDCYIGAYFFPANSTNPYSFHYHLEPDNWRQFAHRFLRDLVHRDHLWTYFAGDPAMLRRFRDSIDARDKSHAELTKVIWRHGDWTRRTLHSLNTFLKACLRLRYRTRLVPAEICKQSRFFRGVALKSLQSLTLGSLCPCRREGGQSCADPMEHLRRAVHFHSYAAHRDP